ncbi:hypothetical protein CSKR_113743, partial [Clonorchis sinensis]
VNLSTRNFPVSFNVSGVLVIPGASSILRAVCIIAPRELSADPVQTILEDTRKTSWVDWQKNTPKFVGWRQHSRAGTGQLVYGVCERRILSPTVSNEAPTLLQPHRAVLMHTATAYDEYWLFSSMYPSGMGLSTHVDIVFQLQDCASNSTAAGEQLSSCHETIDLMIRYTNMSYRVTSPKGFELLQHVSHNGPHFEKNQLVVGFLRIFSVQFRANSEWFQLALRDRGSCILVDHIVVYRLSCARVEVNLIEFPETPSGHTGELQSIEGRCVVGAVQLNNSKVANQAFCLPNGKWRLYSDVHCVCNAGYELQSGRQSCE